jgi:hypothetical protein
MKRNFLILVVVFFALSTFGQARSQSASGVEDLSRPAGHEPPMLGIHWARGFNPSYLQQKAHQQKAHKGPPITSSSPDMTYHGGNVLLSTTTASIFWGPSWGDPGFTGDKITGMDSWYGGFGGSPYATTSDEYSGSNGRVTSSSTYQGSPVDTSRASSGNRSSNILAEVCKEFPIPERNGYYAVYVDLPRKGSYCAYHSWGSCNGTPIEFAFFWNLDGDAGCDPQDTLTGHSQGLAALANVSGHELAEAITDPTGNGWYDSGGSENGDKCVWTFNVPLVTFSNSTAWKIQGEWSNAAYDAHPQFGYPNSAGQKGCLDGDATDEYKSKSP